MSENEKNKKSYWNYSKEELFDACEKRGISFEETPSQKEIVETLFAWDREHGTLDEVVELDENQNIVNPRSRRYKEEMINVIFHNKDEQDLPYVPIGLNGRFFYIPKDQPVLIPKTLITSVIKDAIEVKISPRRTVDGKIVYDERKVQRFPYSIVE